jgi:hypothetical protein
MESKNWPINCFSRGHFGTKTTSKNGETPQRLGLSGVLQKVRECFLTLHMVVENRKTHIYLFTSLRESGVKSGIE